MKPRAEELYLEILYQILNNDKKRKHMYVSKNGCEVDEHSMLSYIQEAFKISNEKHAELLKQAKAKQFPELMLNVEVIEGKDLVPTDSRGLSDPLVTIYLMSNASRRYRTSVKLATLNPKWEEHFSLAVAGSLNDDSLCLEVWDSAEVNKGIASKFEDDGVKSLSKLPFAITASKKMQDRLIGRANIHLKLVKHVSEMTKYLKLNSESVSRQGFLKVRCSLSFGSDKRFAIQEHQRLLRILLLHELGTSQVGTHWCGNFSQPAEAILTEYVAQNRICDAESSLTQWIVFCALITDHPLSFTLFVNLFDKIYSSAQSGLVNVTLFWEGVKNLLVTCFGRIKAVRNPTVEHEIHIKTVSEVLNILNKVSVIEIPKRIDLFPAESYDWLTYKNDGNRLTIHEVLRQAVIQRASDWFLHILGKAECKDKTEESRLQHLMRVIQLVRSDLQQAVEYLDKIFAEVASFPYSKVLSDVLESKLTLLMEPEVMIVCRSLKGLRLSEGPTYSELPIANGDSDAKPMLQPAEFGSDPSCLTMGTTLFELYIALQRLGQDLNEIGWSVYTELKFHSWFFGGVTLWLDMASFKVFIRIDKAVELDNLMPVDPHVNHSSSGVDTVAIFYQIYQTFWQQLAWPVDEDSFSFIVKIVDDICRCCKFYSDRMYYRLQAAGEVREELFQVTTQCCVIINNIDFVRQSLSPFVDKLGIDDIIQRLCQRSIPPQIQRCRYRDTLNNLIENAIDTVNTKIEDFLEVLIKKMIPSIMKLLIECAELLQNDCASMDRIMRYLEANFDTFHQHLNNENFSRSLDLFWQQLGEVLYNLIQANVKKHRPSIFFRNLQECLTVMEQSLRRDDQELRKTDTLKRVEYLLKNHGTETKELIHQYHLERWQEQQAITDAKMGLLTVRAQFIEDHLKIEILNARKLTPTDSKNLCNSYVKVSLLPKYSAKLKTPVHTKNLFPLYNEMFLIPLSPEQSRAADGLVHLVVKDKDMLSNTFMGEAYLHFSEVPHTPAPISSLPQQHLPLSTPTSNGGEIIEMLEFRQNDKLARRFLMKQIQRKPNDKHGLASATPDLGIPASLARLLPRSRAEELYLEILYQILDNISKHGYVYVSKKGCEVDEHSMLSYIQEAFKISNEKHAKLLKQAKAKQFPELMLNVEVIEGKDLVPTDSRGLSDPLVTIYLMSNASRRYRTSVKLATFNPKWEEHFSLTVAGSLNGDSLCLEVWDSAVVNKGLVSKFEYDGVTSLPKLAKDFDIAASKKTQDTLIGSVNIPLQSIAVDEMTKYLKLNSENESRQGFLKVRCSLSFGSDIRFAIQEHRRLLRILLLHELESSQVATYWCGDFSHPAEAILTEYVAQNRICETDNWLTQWIVFCALITDHPLSFTLFDSLFDKINNLSQSGLLNENDVTLFWEGVKNLLPTCFGHIKALRDTTAEHEIVIKTLTEVLTILYKMSVLELPKSIDLFPAELYDWLTYKNGGNRLTIHEVLRQAVIQSASDWFLRILDEPKCKDETEESRLQHLIRVIQLVRSDLQQAVEYLDKVFVEVASFPYSKVLSDVLESKITVLMEPEVMIVCRSLQGLRLSEGPTSSEVPEANGDSDAKPILQPAEFGSDPSCLAMGTTLFELYLSLKRLLQDLNEIGWSMYTELKFHSWFYGGVTLWLDMAAFRALMRIDKAVELDNLMPVDPHVNHSSSGVDTVAIFYQIYQTFWQQLAWPVDEDSFSFVAKIVDDICRCCKFYSDRMYYRLQAVGEVREELFHVTTQCCVIINNIDFVRQSLSPFVDKLGIDDIIQRLCKGSKPPQTQRYRETLNNLIENAIDTVNTNIVVFLEVLIKKMIPSIIKLIIDCAELLQKDCSSTDRIMRYLEANFDTFHQHLNNENFSRSLDLFWQQLGEVLYNLIQANLAKHRPPIFFRNLQECLTVMEQSLRRDDQELRKTDTLKRVEYLLKNHGTETKELIHQYHLERWQEQQAITDAKMGLLTVRAQFIENHLKIEILNARKLTPTDSKNLCNSYVNVGLLPKYSFSNAVKLKTQVHSSNSFPLYNEVFLIPLSPEQSCAADALVHLVVKDKDMFSVSNTFMGEAYLHFSEVPHTPAPISNLPQQHLPLSRPANFGGEIIEMLEFRQTDKLARKFLKKQIRRKANNKHGLASATPDLGIPASLARLLPSRVIGSFISLALHNSKARKASRDGQDHS